MTPVAFDPPTEACPSKMLFQEMPEYGGLLFLNPDTGLAGCPACGYSAPPPLDPRGRASTFCPACHPASRPRVARNLPCPCGSGIKAKRCPCEAYAA